MSAITIDEDLVHYEVLGRGKPVILLHGWLGSWRYWIPAMQQLSMKYRTYALDLWGFGDSGKDARRYGFESQVALLDQFMEKLGITKAALIGHGLGAAVAVRYTTKHPDRVPRLMVISPPLFRMAPPVNPLTANPPPSERAGLPAAAKPDELAAPKPAESPAAATPSEPPAAVKPEESPAASTAPVSGLDLLTMPSSAMAEADTLPIKSEEMKARIRAALERRVQEGQAPVAPGGTPKSPQDATKPPTDQLARVVSSSSPITPPLPEPLPEVPAMPKIDYVPDTHEVQVQQENPLKDHLQILDPMELLEKHVEAGTDLEKLKVEVSKTDRQAIVLSIESFAGVDTLRDLKALDSPVVTIYGAKDTFLPLPDAEMITSLKEGRPNAHVIAMEDVRHFPMLENIAQFTRLMLDFLEIPDVTKLEIKKTWERRVR